MKGEGPGSADALSDCCKVLRGGRWAMTARRSILAVKAA
jgi:hypothetical protein